MSPANTDDAALRFGPFTLQPRRRRLLRGADELAIGSRALDLLVLLARRAGELIGKDELLADLWPGRVVDEGALRVHVAALRKLLGCGQGGSRYIENVPLRGYRFVAPVTREGLSAAAATAAPVASVDEARQPVSALPAAAVRLLGRASELQQLSTHLPQRRLVTLTGPGGIGKTALALEAARALQADYTHGAVFVDLAPLENETRVAPALAAALGVPVLSGDPLPALVAALQRRRMLLVLDNCEHVVAEAARVAEALVARCAGVDVLATSREPLRAAGEWVQRVPPLGVDAGDGSGPAVQLLFERASLAPEWLAAHPSESAAALQVCRRLDGMPLAIELAAMQVDAFGLSGLAQRLDEHMLRSAGTRRGGLERHRTLRAALDWSHALLDDEERIALRRLAAFRGGFTMSRAAAVVADEALPPARALEALATLSAKSLLAVQDEMPGQPRELRLLATTREYAAEKLAAQPADEVTALRRRHAQQLHATLEEAGEQLAQVGALRGRGLHAGRLDDLRAALAWALDEGGDAELAASLVAAAAPLWFHLGLVHEVLHHVERLQPVLPALAADPLRRMRLELARGHAHLHIAGAGAASDAALRASLAIATEQGWAYDRLRALWGLFTERMMRGDYAVAHGFALDFGQVAEGLDDHQAVLTGHRLLALVLHKLGRHRQAQAQAEQALQSPAAEPRFLHGSAYQVDHRASALVPLARTRWMQGRGQEAAALAHEAVQRAAQLDHGFSLTFSLALAALPIALWNGDLPAAQAYTAQLRECALRHSLEFWQTWDEMYVAVIRWRQLPGTAPGAWLAESARHPGRADLLATVHPALLNATALQRAQQGRNGWCTAEVQRVAALADLAAGRCDRPGAVARLQRALELAREQDAWAWELRLATSLAQLQPVSGWAALRALLDRWPGDRHGPDWRAAQVLLDSERSK